MHPVRTTLLDHFLHLASNESSDKEFIHCAEEVVTYGELDTIASSIASKIASQHGHRPTVAIICENHPLTIILLLAVWKLGGIVAPLDSHAPSDLMQAMLQIVAPTYVVLPSSDVHNHGLVQSLGLYVESFEPQENTIAAFRDRFLRSPLKHTFQGHHSPQFDEVCLYMFTSSASSSSELKCVPVTHGNLVTNSRSQLNWFRENLNVPNLERLRVLGWSPFSHIMSICIDLCTSIFTGGCYIFALTPSMYSIALPEKDKRYDVPKQILESILDHKPDVFAGVPWILDGLRTAWNTETDSTRRTRLDAALKKFKYFISSGAATSKECLQWSEDRGLPVLVTIGMTELGGALFQSLPREAASGWSIESSSISDAVFTLIDGQGNTVDNGSSGGSFIREVSLTRMEQQRSASFINRGDGLITFRTGDIYERLSDSGRLIWKGRKDDFIQLKSGETLDPRVVENLFNTSPLVAHSCVVGNTFLSTAADFICAIIELTSAGSQNIHSSRAQLSKVLATVNRGLTPPLRIAWTHILFLSPEQHIPYTRKRSIFRKKLQALFGQQLLTLLNSTSQTEPGSHFSEPIRTAKTVSTSFSKDGLVQLVFDIVSNVLGVTSDIWEANFQSTFAELGMNSIMATMIVNKLNERLFLSLSPSTCHTYVDMDSLIEFLCEKLDLAPPSVYHTVPTSESVAYKTGRYDPIVIIGQALRLPGDINNSELLWKALIEKRDDILTPAPGDRWDHRSFRGDQSCTINFEKSGFLELASFDNTFFGIPAPEAIFISPSTRLTLETAFEALENANIPMSMVKGTDMGVFVAAGLDTGYNELLFHDMGYDAYGRFYGTGIATSTTCGRLSYLLGIHGPSLTVETACSGGLVALDLAVRHLESGRGESAIVCGTNTHTSPGMFGFLSAQKMTSPSSRSATFTREADGYAASEGAVSLIIKTMSAAMRDGNNILGVIRATNTMHNGKTQGLVAPSTAGQIALQRSLLRLSSLNPEDIDLLETHGTGTSLGDLMEIQGINEVFHKSHTISRPLVLGAAKPCIGHTETASGLVGVVKTLLSFSKNTVPGIMHLNEANMNPEIDCSVIPMHIPIYPITLMHRSTAPYRALVVAYGFAGTISGTVLEAPTIAQPMPSILQSVSSPMIFVVSAKTDNALTAYIRSYLDFCRQASNKLFRSICYTSCIGREHYRYRFACVATSMEDLVHKLQKRLSGNSPGAIRSSSQLILGFPGQGSQFNGMARDLANKYSGFRSILTEYALLATSFSGDPILPLLLQTTGCDIDINQSQIAQVCIFVYQCSVAKWLQTLGIEPQGVIGHSLGEIAAAVSSGALDYSSGLQFVVVRANALATESLNVNSGAMVAIEASEPEVMEYIRTLDVADRVVIAVFNGARSLVISGIAPAVDLVFITAKKDGKRCVKLKVDQGFHSPSIESALPVLKAWLENNETILKPLEIPFFSTVIAEKIPPKQFLRAGYWVEHARKPVRFQQAALKINVEKSFNIILDVGPQPTMWTAMQGLNLTDKILLATTAKEGKDQELALLEAIAKLFESHVSVDLSKLYAERGELLTKTNIPTYPFQRQRHYPTFLASRNTIPRQINDSRPDKGVIELLSVEQALVDLLHDHRIEGRQILPGVAFVDLLARLSSNSAKYVANIRFHRPLVLEHPGTSIRAALELDGSFKIFQDNSAEDIDKICSGSLFSSSGYHSTNSIIGGKAPIRTLNQAQIYAPFENNLYFGPAFRNITQLSMWSDHVDALITVSSSPNSNLDRIRTLDPCLHMFGALVQFVDIPDSMREEGFYLPTSLEGYALHSDNLPTTFICRYFLPFIISHNHRSVSISLQVLSPAGELLVSCEKYSVAWLPKGVAIQEPVSRASPYQWLRSTWSESDILLESRSSKQIPGNSTVVYFGISINPELLAPFVKKASEVYFVGPCVPGFRKIDPIELKENFGSAKDGCLELVDELAGKDISIVLDATCYLQPGSDSFSAFVKHAIRLMKLTMSGRFTTSSFVVISYLSSPAKLAYPLAVSSSPPTVSSVLQGILHVYSRESGLTREVAWSLELPVDLSGDIKTDIIGHEIAIRQERGPRSSYITAYQMKSESDEKSFVRLVPILIPAAPAHDSYSADISLSGVTVIVGMGSIGYALASYLAAAKSSTVVFLGRRNIENSTVAQDLERLRGSFPGALEYIKCDVADLSEVRRVLQDIKSRFKVINNIVHTAGVVCDATLNNVTDQEIDQVLNPKVLGAWNLHIVSLELELNLASFIMLSSISVTLGNPGQAAYVGANSFLDSLAAYRQEMGLHGVSLQLGAWESKLIEGLNFSSSMVLAMRHEEGMPFIQKALKISDPVQVIAKLDLEKLTHNPTFANDPIFGEVKVDDNSKDRKSVVKRSFSQDDVKETIISEVRGVLELRSTDELDLEESLISYGIDSISFAQVRGRVLQAVNVDIPMLYLSDSFSINDMITSSCKGLSV